MPTAHLTATWPGPVDVGSMRAEQLPCIICLPILMLTAPARTHRHTHKVTDATDHPTHSSVTTGVGKQWDSKWWICSVNQSSVPHSYIMSGSRPAFCDGVTQINNNKQWSHISQDDRWVTHDSWYYKQNIINNGWLLFNWVFIHCFETVGWATGTESACKQFCYNYPNLLVL